MVEPTGSFRRGAKRTRVVKTGELYYVGPVEVPVSLSLFRPLPSPLPVVVPVRRLLLYSRLFFT